MSLQFPKTLPHWGYRTFFISEINLLSELFTKHLPSKGCFLPAPQECLFTFKLFSWKWTGSQRRPWNPPDMFSSLPVCICSFLWWLCWPGLARIRASLLQKGSRPSRSEGIFRESLGLLSFDFSCSPKKANYFHGARQESVLTDLQIYSGSALTVGLTQCSSRLPSILFTQNQTMRMDLRRPPEFSGEKSESAHCLKSKPSHVYAVGTGDVQELDQGHCISRHSEITS